jgi:hypothetical protein
MNNAKCKMQNVKSRMPLTACLLSFCIFHCLSMGGNETLAFRRNLQDTLDGGVPLGSAFGLGILAKRARNL